MFEFKRGGFSKKSSSMLSPAHVFPLPPMNWKERILSLDVFEENEFLQCLYYCGNLIVSGTSGIMRRYLCCSHEGAWQDCQHPPGSGDDRWACPWSPGNRRLFEAFSALLGKWSCTSSRSTRWSPWQGGWCAVGRSPGDFFSGDESASAEPYTMLLIKSRKRPKLVKRGYTWLAPSYGELVRKNVKAGLHKLKQPHQVARYREKQFWRVLVRLWRIAAKIVLSQTPKSISSWTLDVLPRPKFAFIPSMRGVSVPRHGLVVVSKRDARHYFHRLWIGRPWGRWLCGPPIDLPKRSGGVTQHVSLHRVWSIRVTLDADLPQDRRLHPDK
jgi:hypothetical protein